MKAIKKINNNVAYCVDGNGRELIALGKGIGFGSFPRDLSLTEIERTFYNIDSRVSSAIADIDEEIIRASVDIIDYANSLISEPLSPAIVFTMADHINFTIQRYKDGNKVKLPIVYDIQYLFENEYKVGLYAVKLIGQKLKIFLPKEEASYIALHIVNSKTQSFDEHDDETIIEKISEIIETHFAMAIDKNDFSYSRFVSHMHYLLKRIRESDQMEDKNSEMYISLSKQYPDMNNCVEDIASYVNQKLNVALSSEEKMYILLHVNRLYDREKN